MLGPLRFILWPLGGVPTPRLEMIQPFWTILKYLAVKKLQRVHRFAGCRAGASLWRQGKSSSTPARSQIRRAKFSFADTSAARKLLMQRCAQAYLSSTGSLTRRWVHAAYDLSLCNDTEAAELDKRLQLINGNVWCEIFNTPSPFFPRSSSGLYGSACKRCFTSSVHRENSGYLRMLEIVQCPLLFSRSI